MRYIFGESFSQRRVTIQYLTLQVVLSGVENTESFFVQWATRCLPDENKYRSLEMHPPQDAAKVRSSFFFIYYLSVFIFL